MDGAPGTGVGTNCSESAPRVRGRASQQVSPVPVRLRVWRLSDNEHYHGRIGQSFPADDGNPSREALCFQSLPEAPLWHGKCTIGV